MQPASSVLMLLLASPFLTAQAVPPDGVFPATSMPVSGGRSGGGSGVLASVSCLQVNWNDVPGGNTGVLGNFAILANSGASGLVVCGVELFIGTVNGTTVTTNVDLFDRPTGTTPGTSLGTTTMTVGGVVSPHTATFAAPIIIPPATDFFIVLDNRPNLRLPISVTGTPGTHYFMTTTTWNGPFSTVFWSYRFLCCGSDLTSGVYSTYGTGCTGSGSGSCLAVNAGLPAGWIAGQPFPGAGNYALLANSGPSGQVICSIDLLCSTLTGVPSTNSVWIYDRPTAGGPPGAILATSSMNVGVLPTQCNASFSPPVVISPITDYFIVFDNRPSLRVPTTTTGVTVTHYFGGPPTWTGPTTNTRWTYSVNCCASGAVPVLSATGRPRFGGGFSINLTKAAPSALALLLTGFSNTNWLGIPLPLDMTVIGAPGCSLLAPGTLIGVTVANSNGDGVLPFSIPADTSLHAAHFYQQWLVQDAAVNMLGFVTSQGGDGRIGD